MSSLPPDKVAVLQRTINEHLRSLDVYSQVQNHLKDFAAKGGGTKEEAIKALREKGLVEELIRTLKGKHFSSIPSLPLISGDQRYLLLRIVRGGAFLEFLKTDDEEGNSSTQLSLSVSFQKQRFVSHQVPAHVDPTFDETFLFNLQKQGNEILPSPAEPERLLFTIEQIHIAVVRTDKDGQKGLVGTTSLEWRKVLLAGSISATIEVWGIGEQANIAAGLLDIRLELLPFCKEFISENTLQDQLKSERISDADSTARFVAYAKSWWQQYLQLRETHRNRLVKILAHAENGSQRPLCTFLQPLTGGRLIGSPLEAARFVSLLGYREQQALTGNRAEVWSNIHTFLARGHGDREDHAILLCSLLLGFGLNAYVCIGKDRRGGHAWVITRPSKAKAVFWESLTGRRYPQEDPVAMDYCPYQTIGCVFNHKRFYANIQVDDLVHRTIFDFENEAHWKRMPEDYITPLRRAPSVQIRPSGVNGPEEEARIESKLRQLISAHRKKLKMSVAWDDNLSFLLMPALVAYEHEAVFGSAPGNDEFQQSIKRAVPAGHTFKGFPQQFDHRAPETMLTSLWESETCADILRTQGDQLKLAVRAKVFTYPEDVCSTWVMVAVKFQKLAS